MGFLDDLALLGRHVPTDAKNKLAEILREMPITKIVHGQAQFSPKRMAEILRGMPVFDKEAANRDMQEVAMNMGPLALGKIVYHGSPHKFDKFDASKIGTGEGAQAYGHGVYLADSEKVASQYKPADSVFATADKRIERIPSGALYKADLPDEWIPKMLDWDKPLSQQSPEVQKAIDAHIGKVVSFDPINDTTFRMNFSGAPIGGYWGDKNKAIQEAKKYITGKQFYEAAGKLDNISYPDSAAFLKGQGIPGIRYLDGGSRPNAGRISMLEQTIANLRGKGSSQAAIANAQRELDAELARSSYNYVVFPGLEDQVKILERNGVPINRLAEIVK